MEKGELKKEQQEMAEYELANHKDSNYELGWPAVYITVTPPGQIWVWVLAISIVYVWQ